MKADVFHSIRDIRFDDDPEPAINDPNDTIVLHMVRGSWVRWSLHDYGSCSS